VPQQYAWVVERLGKAKVLQAGLHFLIPVVDRIAYVHSLKEQTIAVPNQTAVTSDNVTINIDGVLYVKIVDPERASYGVQDPLYAVTQLAQTTMRSELGKMSLDRTFKERESINAAILDAINEAAPEWGLRCLRYEIRDIVPPPSVKSMMDMQAEAERRKRAQILDSEAERDAETNIAEGHKNAAILTAQAEAESIKIKASATAEGLQRVAVAIGTKGGDSAMALSVAQQYVGAFGNIAKEGNTILLPSNAADPGSMVAQALGIFKHMHLAPSNSSSSQEAKTPEEKSEAPELVEAPEVVAAPWLTHGHQEEVPKELPKE